MHFLSHCSHPAAGTKGSTKPFTISERFAPTLLPGATTTQLFELPDLGDLLTIDIELTTNQLKDLLHLRYAVVVDAATKCVTVFPCYRWIESKFTIRNGNGKPRCYVGYIGDFIGKDCLV